MTNDIDNLNCYFNNINHFYIVLNTLVKDLNKLEGVYNEHKRNI